jgi:rhodanese-related sulfurtransferase
VNVEELEAHVRGMMPDTRILPMDRLRQDLSLGCVDGRNPGCVAGAPGGNAGLLVLLLASLEEVTGQPLSPGDVRTVFEQYRRHFGTFYLHSDQPALLALGRALHGAPHRGGDTGRLPGADALEGLVRNPPEALRPHLLELVSMPAHVGCGHLRLLLSEPGAYRARPELTTGVIRAFFQALWEGDDAMLFDVLPGDHQEEAVVQVHADAPELLVACPHYGAMELFVHHPDAVAWMQERQARFAAEEGWILAEQVPRLLAVQQRLGALQLQATLERLAPGLPVFDLHLPAPAGIEGDALGLPLRITFGGVVPMAPIFDRFRSRPAGTSPELQQELPLDLDAADFMAHWNSAGPRENPLLDVRREDEFAAGHLEGAVLVDVTAPDFRERIQALSLDPEAPVYLYCRSGNRSGHAARVLREMGIGQAVNVGGLDDLVTAGGTLARND